MVENLAQTDVDGSGDRAQIPFELQRQRHGLGVVASLDLDVHLGGHSEIENLAYDIGLFEVKSGTRKVVCDFSPDPILVSNHRLVLGFQSDGHLDVLLCGVLARNESKIVK